MCIHCLHDSREFFNKLSERLRCLGNTIRIVRVLQHIERAEIPLAQRGFLRFLALERFQYRSLLKSESQRQRRLVHGYCVIHVAEIFQLLFQFFLALPVADGHEWMVAN